MLIPKHNKPDYAIWSGHQKPTWEVLQEVFNKSESSYMVSFYPEYRCVYDRGGSEVIKLDCDVRVTTDAMRALAGAILEATGGYNEEDGEEGAGEVNRKPVPPRSGGEAA